MKPVTMTVTAGSAVTTATNWLAVDRFPDDFDLSFAVAVATVGSAFGSYTVQHTFINVALEGTAAVTSQAIFDHPTVSGQSAAADGSYTEPIAAIRLQLTGGSAAAASANQASITVIQTGS